MASLALHALLLFVLPVLQEAQRAGRAPAALSARLASQAPAEPASPNVEPPARPAPRSLAPRLAQIAKTAPGQAVLPPSAPAPSAGPEPAKPVADTANAVPPAPQQNVPKAETQPAAAAGLDADAVARYRLELMDLASQAERYPGLARDNGWQGRVDLRIAIGEDGAISSISVKKSAGRAVLDNEAQAMLRDAKSKAPIPQRLRGKAFALDFSVTFVLRKEQQ